MTKSIRAADYIYRLQVDGRVIHRQLDGLTNEDLLLQPDMRGNCANWVLGHIIQSRHELMQTLDIEPIWSAEELALYEPNSEPITSADSPHLSMDKLLADLKATEEKLVARLETITDDELETELREKLTLGKSVNFSIWHEGYHVGQFEYLRQLTGIADKVI